MGDKVVERTVRQIHSEGVTVSGDLTVYGTKSAEARIKELEAELAEAREEWGKDTDLCAKYSTTIERLREELARAHVQGLLPLPEHIAEIERLRADCVCGKVGADLHATIERLRGLLREALDEMVGARMDGCWSELVGEIRAALEVDDGLG